MKQKVVRINLIETIIVVIMVSLIILTAISEPAISFQYGKAMFGSGKKLIKMVKPVIEKTVDAVSKDKVLVNDTNTQSHEI